jgi:transcriptional regulator with XRE-family HTH domain
MVISFSRLESGLQSPTVVVLEKLAAAYTLTDSDRQTRLLPRGPDGRFGSPVEARNRKSAAVPSRQGVNGHSKRQTKTTA